jgi:hypothetical protein
MAEARISGIRRSASYKLPARREPAKRNARVDPRRQPSVKSGSVKRDAPKAAAERNQTGSRPLSRQPGQRHLPVSRTVGRMITDIHSLQLPLLCQLSKSTPNILWSVGSSLNNQFLQVGRGHPALMVARMSFSSVLGRHARGTARDVVLAGKPSRAQTSSAIKEESRMPGIAARDKNPDVMAW